MRAEKIIVLGASMVGSAIAADLCREYAVTAVDVDRTRIDAFASRFADLSDRGVVLERGRETA